MRFLPRLLRRIFPRRHIPTSTTSTSTTSTTSTSRTTFSRLPPRIQHLAGPLRTAPLTHITAFLILHEITAILPLGMLWWGIHKLDIITLDTAGEKEREKERERGRGREGGKEGITGRAAKKWNEWVMRGRDRFGNYLAKKGWLINLSPKDAARVVVELGTAWAVVKILLPVRVVGCLWMTPWFARVFVGRVAGWLRRG